MLFCRFDNHFPSEGKASWYLSSRLDNLVDIRPAARQNKRWHENNQVTLMMKWAFLHLYIPSILPMWLDQQFRESYAASPSVYSSFLTNGNDGKSKFLRGTSGLTECLKWAGDKTITAHQHYTEGNWSLPINERRIQFAKISASTTASVWEGDT